MSKAIRPRRLKLETARLRGDAIKLFVEKRVLIWSDEHRSYWRPKSAGYTTVREDAGIYFFEDAYQRTQHCGPEKKIIYELVTGVVP